MIVSHARPDDEVNSEADSELLEEEVTRSTRMVNRFQDSADEEVHELREMIRDKCPGDQIEAQVQVVAQMEDICLRYTRAKRRAVDAIDRRRAKRGRLTATAVAAGPRSPVSSPPVEVVDRVAEEAIARHHVAVDTPTPADSVNPGAPAVAVPSGVGPRDVSRVTVRQTRELTVIVEPDGRLTRTVRGALMVNQPAGPARQDWRGYTSSRQRARDDTEVDDTNIAPDGYVINEFRETVPLNRDSPYAVTIRTAGVRVPLGPPRTGPPATAMVHQAITERAHRRGDRSAVHMDTDGYYDACYEALRDRGYTKAYDWSPPPKDQRWEELWVDPDSELGLKCTTCLKGWPHDMSVNHIQTILEYLGPLVDLSYERKRQAICPGYPIAPDHGHPTGRLWATFGTPASRRTVNNALKDLKFGEPPFTISVHPEAVTSGVHYSGVLECFPARHGWASAPMRSLGDHPLIDGYGWHEWCHGHGGHGHQSHHDSYEVTDTRPAHSQDPRLTSEFDLVYFNRSGTPKGRGTSKGRGRGKGRRSGYSRGGSSASGLRR